MHQLSLLYFCYLFLFAHLSFCSTLTLHPTVIPLNPAQPDLENANRGYYEWFGLTTIPTPSYDSYDRYDWSDLEPSEGNYDFSSIIAALVNAQSKQGRYGFRVCSLNSQAGGVQVPSYLQQAQQTAGRGFYYYPYGAATNNTPAQDPSITWCPDWNDPFFLSRAQLLVQALANAVANNTRLWFIDVGIYGDFGEWHVSGVPYPGPHGEGDMTVANKNFVVDLISNNFPKQYWVFQMFNPANNDTGYYAYYKSPKFGIRNDCFSSPLWDDMPTYQIWRVLSTRWQTAPVIAEFCYMSPGNPIGGTSGDPSFGLRQVTEFNVAMISNGNLDTFTDWPAAQQQQLLQIGQLSGYRLQIDTLTVPSTVVAGQCLAVTIIWDNVNTGAIYEDWSVMIQLRNASFNYGSSLLSATVIYDDALASSWTDWSSYANLQDQDVTPFKGIYCMKYTPAGEWTVAELHYNPTSLFDLTPFTHFHIAVRTAQAASYMGVRLDGAGDFWVMFSDWGPTPNASAWTEYLIPLSAFSAVGVKIENILFQDQTGNPANIYYFDDIEFRTYGTPNPNAAIIWSGKSGANLRSALPVTVKGKYQVADHLLVPTTTKSGTYDLYIQVTNPYYPPMALANTGRISDGSYKITSGISITSGTTTATCAAAAGSYVQQPVVPFNPPQYFYSDSVDIKWTAGASSGADLNLSSTAVPAYSGSYSIQFTTAVWSVLGFYTSSGINTAGYTHFHLAVRSNSASNDINFLLNANGPHVTLASYGGNPPVNTWKSYMIPLSVLGATNTWVTELQFQDIHGTAGITYYFDEISIVNAAYTVYDDKLASSWTQVGQSSTVSLANTSPASFQGNYNIKFTGTAALGNVDLYCSVGFTTTSYTHLTFYARSAQTSTQIWVAVFPGTFNSATDTTLSLNSYGGQPSSAWKYYSIPLTAFKLTNPKINHIVFGDATGSTGLTYYYDLVQLV